MEETMQKAGRRMSLYMGVTLSFILSLVGTVTSNHFTLSGFLISFVASSVIAILIGFFVPMGKIGRSIQESMNMDADAVPVKLVTALVADLIYTPILTFLMILLAYRRVTAHGGSPNFWGMFLPSLVISMVVAYFCIIFIEPVFMKKVMNDLRKPRG